MKIYRKDDCIMDNDKEKDDKEAEEEKQRQDLLRTAAISAISCSTII